MTDRQRPEDLTPADTDSKSVEQQDVAEPVGAKSRTALAFARPSWVEASYVAGILRKETVGGGLLLAAAALAIIFANTPLAGWYDSIRHVQVGPSAPFHLDLTLHQWAADGLLAIFFFVAGVELKREFVAGELRDPRRAIVPVAAAIGGVVVPALIYVLTVRGHPDMSHGWAIPTATDIAFALAVLAVLGSFLPVALRSFLLTLAVVDDLIAITIIAVFYTMDLEPLMLGLAMIPLALFAVLLHRGITSWWLLLPLALITWVFVHESGVHATVAGVLLGLVVPVHASKRRKIPIAETFEHELRPISTGVAVPIFAFMAAGVPVVGGAFGEAITHKLLWAIILALVVGKVIGVLAGAWLTVRLTKAQLDEDLSWWDIIGVSLLAGIGFTVSLLVSELAFDPSGEFDEISRLGVLLGSLMAAALAAVVLRIRNRVYRKIHERETEDLDNDGIPDIYQRPSSA